MDNDSIIRNVQEIAQIEAARENTLNQNRATDYINGLTSEKRQLIFGGVSQLYSVLQEEKALRLKDEDDRLLVFFPFRGASPIYWMVDQYAKESGLSGGLQNFSILLFPPVGTAVDLHNPNILVGGIEAQQKKSIIKPLMKTVLDEYPEGLGMRNQIKGVVIIDEVQKGGTITQFKESVSGSLIDLGFQKIPFTVIGVQDENMFGKQPVSRKYRDLLESSDSNIKFQAVPMPLFVDVDPMLAPILQLAKDKNKLRPDSRDTQPLRIAERREAWVNPSAEKALRDFISQEYNS